MVDERNLKELAARDHRSSKAPVLLGGRKLTAGMIVGEKKANGIFFAGKPHRRPHDITRMSEASVGSAAKEQLACDKRLVRGKHKHPKLLLFGAHERSCPVGGLG